MMQPSSQLTTLRTAAGEIAAAFRIQFFSRLMGSSAIVHNTTTAAKTVSFCQELL